MSDQIWFAIIAGVQAVILGALRIIHQKVKACGCLLYTSDAADE